MFTRQGYVVYQDGENVVDLYPVPHIDIDRFIARLNGAAAPTSKFLVVGIYRGTKDRWADSFECETPEEAEALAPPNVTVCAVIKDMEVLL